jgi:hypothetical protein
MTSVAALGWITLLVRSRRLGIVISAMLLFYSIFFSMQVVFFARNFIFLLPVLAFLAAIGFDALLIAATGLSNRRYRIALTLLLCVLFGGVLVWNSIWQVSAGLSIPEAKRQPLIKQVASYLANHPKERVAITSTLTQELASAGIALPSDVVQPSQAQLFLFRFSELKKRHARLTGYPSSRHGIFHWIGAREMNMDYYPIFYWPERSSGKDHVVILDGEHARAYGVYRSLFETPIK